MGAQLELGDAFPQLDLRIANGDDLSLPAYLDTPYSVVLFYRGHW